MTDDEILIELKLINAKIDRLDRICRGFILFVFALFAARGLAILLGY